IQIVVVKLADRVHNLRTLDSLPRERQERMAQESLEIYAPIAHRLGMGKIRAEIEDLAFKYLDPDAFDQITKELEAQRRANETFLHQIQKTVEMKLARENIPARVDARLKRPYSIYQKMKRQRIGMDQMFDLLAIRILTDSVKNCYAALGVIHNEWTPV